MINSLTYCQNCQGNCCYIPKISGFVAVNLEDAERIKKITGLDYAEFLNFSSLSRSMVQEMKDVVRTDFPHQSTESAFRLKTLMPENRLLKMKTKNRRCYFLDEQEKCSIYEDAPGICRLYPYWFAETSSGLEIVLHECGAYCSLSKIYPGMSLFPSFDSGKLLTAAESIITGLERYLSQVQGFVRKNKIGT